MKKNALIIGISGQDGSYLARFLLKKKYNIYGTSRDAKSSDFTNLKKLNILKHVKIFTMLPENLKSILSILKKVKPDEVYYLAGQSSVGLSFKRPAQAIQSNVLGTLNLLEACRLISKKPKIYHAGSSECFGNTMGKLATEKTSFHPESPYGVAKASAYWIVNNYREAYNLYACTGILFNHESPLRSENFVTQKIVSAAKRIYEGSIEVLELGRLDISRDWGWAPDYVEAMWLMLQQKKPDDFVIATGESHSLEIFVKEVFEKYNLNWKNHVVLKPELKRPTDLRFSCGDATKARLKLKWKPKHKMKEVINLMISNKI